MASAVKTILLLVIALFVLAIGFKVLVSVLAWTLKMAFLALLVLLAVAFISKLLRSA